MHTAREVVLYLCAAMVVWSGSRLIQRQSGADRRPPLELVRRLWRPIPPPVATFLAVLMAVMTILQVLLPSLVGTLERDPGGGWWHYLTALLVQSGGWTQIIFNYAALLLIAPFAERTVGSRAALLAYLVPGIAAQIVSTASWYPIGAGNSVALCGQLAACATLYLLRGTEPKLRRQLLMIPAATAILCALTNNHGIGLLAGCVIGAAFAALRFPITAVPEPSSTDHLDRRPEQRAVTP